MNIIALGESVPHVCLRYRVEPVRAAFRTAGHWFSTQAMPRTPWGRLALYKELQNASVVIVQRRLLSPWEVPLLRRKTKHLIFDFDDAVFQKDSYHRKQESSKRMARFQAMVQAADQVFAGNPYLAEQANRFISADKIVLMPTCVDTAHYQPATHHRKGPGVRLVWIGSSSTLRGLELESKLWSAIGKALPGLELYIVCDRFPQWSGIKIIPVPWTQALETSTLASCDIGLAHMPEDAWSRGKCGLKVLQYQAAGLPVVTNPVGVHRDMVEPEVNGFWAHSLSEWIVALGRLMNDPELRQRLGQRGRQQVEQVYSTEQLVHRWKVALKLEHPADLSSKVAA